MSSAVCQIAAGWLLDAGCYINRIVWKHRHRHTAKVRNDLGGIDLVHIVLYRIGAFLGDLQSGCIVLDMP